MDSNTIWETNKVTLLMEERLMSVFAKPEKIVMFDEVRPMTTITLEWVDAIQLEERPDVDEVRIYICDTCQQQTPPWFTKGDMTIHDNH